MLNHVTRGFRINLETLKMIPSLWTKRNAIDFMNFLRGFIAIRDLIRAQFFKIRDVKKFETTTTTWQKTIWKTADFLGNLSLILGAMKSRPGLALGKWAFKKILSPEQIVRFGSQFSEQTLKQKLSSYALLLGIPATIKTCYAVYVWFHHPRSPPLEEQEEHFFTPIPLRKLDIVITAQTISLTAQAVIVYRG